MREEELVEQLMRPEAYPHSPEHVRMLQTHISWVFLTGTYAYKVKKPVDFGFLDFTTLEKRLHYCREELRVNTLAKGMYIDVVPITLENGRLRVEGSGEAVEYAVKMVELPQEAIMKRMLQRGEVEAEDLRRIAEMVAEHHSSTPSTQEARRWGGYEQVVRNWEQNFEQAEPLRPLLPEGEYSELVDRVRGFLDRERQRFEEREEFIKECHGDLHSGNIFIVREPGELYREGIYIFDAIEFFKGFSCSDVLADVAFLAMDLDFHGRSDLSEVFLSEYGERFRDAMDGRMLRFYQCYRAFVRMKVEGFMLAGAGEGERGEIEDRIKRYFTLACRYAKSL